MHDRMVGWAEQLKRRALIGDGLLALALAGMALATAIGSQRWQGTRPPIDALGGALIVGAALPLIVRRVWPLATLMLTAAATSAYLVLAYPYGLILLCLAVAVYTAAARLATRRAAVGGVVA